MTDRQGVGIDCEGVDARFAARLRTIAARHIGQRSGARIVAAGNAGPALRFEIAPGVGADGFRIADAPDGAIRIVAGAPRGLLYGLGRLLRASRYAGGVFLPGAWRGESAPAKPVRGAYFATHFHNFYHEAPLDEVERYIEDQALWGINALTVWFDMHHYRGIDDPDAQRMIARLRALLSAARGLGLSTGLLFIGNEAYAGSPEAMRAEGGGFGFELCPHKPGAKAWMLNSVEERLDAFADLGPDYLWIWPYDTGGCACARCAPWGANGFLSMAEVTARVYRRRVPDGKVILSTWFFDRFAQGEWAGLDRAFRARPDWVDYIMADNVGSAFPDYPLSHGVPGGLPMLSFPEISMVDSFWGGNGANPLPHHFQALWDKAGTHLAGGFPYSEGIYEDINKAIAVQFQWDRNRRAMETVREYIAYEFAPEVVDAVAAAVEILERNNHHALKQEGGVDFIPMNRSADADKALELLRGAESRLPAWARTSWRWRILYLRAMIDAELAANAFRITERCEEAFEELTRIFHAGQAAFSVAPPTREARRLKRPW